MCPMGALKYLIQPLDPYWGSKPQGPFFGPPVTDECAPPLSQDGKSSRAWRVDRTMICVARKARRVSSKLWQGRKDDEYLGFWDTFVPSVFLDVGGRNLR